MRNLSISLAIGKGLGSTADSRSETQMGSIGSGSVSQPKAVCMSHRKSSEVPKHAYIGLMSHSHKIDLVLRKYFAGRGSVYDRCFRLVKGCHASGELYHHISCSKRLVELYHRVFHKCERNWYETRLDLPRNVRGFSMSRKKRASVCG